MHKAMPFPIPRPLPVTRAVFPANENCSSPIFFSLNGKFISFLLKHCVQKYTRCRSLITRKDQDSSFQIEAADF
jgi:hypothetical protein